MDALGLSWRPFGARRAMGCGVWKAYQLRQMIGMSASSKHVLLKGFLVYAKVLLIGGIFQLDQIPFIWRSVFLDAMIWDASSSCSGTVQSLLLSSGFLLFDVTKHRVDMKKMFSKVPKYLKLGCFEKAEKSLQVMLLRSFKKAWSETPWFCMQWSQHITCFVVSRLSSATRCHASYV